MISEPADSPLIPARRHRLVRIVGGHRTPRTAYISLVVALGMALLLFTYWRLWQSDGALDPPPQRPLEQVELTWKCALGHRFKAFGQRGPRACSICARQADIVARYTCGKHEPVDVFVRLGPDWSETYDDRYLRFADTPLAPAATGLTCSRCGLRLRSLGPDPLPQARGKK